MIAIVDYGVGNVRAFLNIFKRLNIEAQIASEPSDLACSDKLILPGVGAFDWAMSQLNRSGLRDELETAVQNRKPVLGVCVGMQMMAKSSEEGALPGLGWISGEVKRFVPAAAHQGFRLPHMGWNDILPDQTHRLLVGVGDKPRFYFLHSYFFITENHDHSIAECDYNGRFTCAIARDNIFGVQFHPEKSHDYGIRLLQNFASL